MMHSFLLPHSILTTTFPQPSFSPHFHHSSLPHQLFFFCSFPQPSDQETIVFIGLDPVYPGDHNIYNIGFTIMATLELKNPLPMSVGQLLRMTKFKNQQRPQNDCESAEVDSSIADQRIRVICVIMVIFALILIAVMLVTSYAASFVAGWVAVVGASIVFGSTGVPMKTPALKSCQVDSFVFALYNSIGIFIVSIPIIAYLLAIQSFQFQPWAILGAADICVIGYLAFMAVQRLGYCKVDFPIYH